MLRFNQLLNRRFYFDCPAKYKIVTGVDSQNKLVIGDLKDWQHILIAGTTGSGKTNFLHAIIHSLIYSNSPDEVKFIIVDLKGDEFYFYDRMSYLKHNIIYEIEEVKQVIKNLVIDMQNRFKTLRENNLRDFEDLKLPRIVLIIDEFHVLSLRDNSITNDLIDLAGRGRAAGIHLILSILKPTTDVINTLIKGVINTKICFMVNTGIESKIVLDEAGAEKINEPGYFILKDHVRTEKLYCPYISIEEIKRIGEIYRDDNLFNDPELLEFKEQLDPLKLDCLHYIINGGKINHWQFKQSLKIGDSKANDLIDWLQSEEIVSHKKENKCFILLKNCEEIRDYYEL